MSTEPSTPPGARSPNNDRQGRKSSPDHPALPFTPRPNVDPAPPRHFPLTQGLPP